MRNRLCKTSGTLLLVFFFCYQANAVRGEEKAQGPGQQGESGSTDNFLDSFSLTSRQEPIDIHSKSLEFFYDEKRVVFRGDVIATQGEETLKSDLLTVTYEEAAPKNGNAPQRSAASTTSRQRLKEIVAEGNVEIVSKNQRATGKKAVFNEASRTVVLSGNAVLQEGQNTVSGERVTIFLDEKRSVVEGGPQGALLVYMPQQKEREQ
jgi:lipopolysaccharide export system protein LptA